MCWKKVESNNDYNDDTQVYEEEQEQNGNNKTVPILLGYGPIDEEVFKSLFIKIKK